jgi:hypothetical protein
MLVVVMTLAALLRGRITYVQRMAVFHRTESVKVQKALAETDIIYRIAISNRARHHD